MLKIQRLIERTRFLFTLQTVLLFHMNFHVLLFISATLIWSTNAQFQNSTIACNKGSNYGGSNGLIYNTACPLARPYCTGSGLCSECAAGKPSLCDCPLNYHCASARYNTVRAADFCAPFPLSVIDTNCATANDCDVQLQDLQTGASQPAFYASCVSTKCRYCDGYAYSSSIRCVQAEVPGGGNANFYGSKTLSQACPPIVNAWNSYTTVLSPPLPTDMFQYERNQYPAPAGTTPSPCPSVSRTKSIGATPSSSPSTSHSPSFGSSASESVVPSIATSSAYQNCGYLFITLSFVIVCVLSS